MRPWLDDSTTTTHYSYAVYADPAMAERFDALRFSGPIGRLIADTQEQRDRGVPRAGRRAAHPRRRHRHRPRGDRAGEARRDRDRRGRVRRDARGRGRGGADGGRAPTRHLRARRRAPPRLSRSQLRRRRLPARADAHAGLARVAARAVPRRVERPRRVRLPVALERGGAAGGRPRRLDAHGESGRSRPIASSRRAPWRACSPTPGFRVHRRAPAVRAADRAAQARQLRSVDAARRRDDGARRA